ncbi:MAG: hypothetical protein IJ230_00535 [Clostridia bacterium]|nr:hypothetical protein [Clostridia bacterium]
MGNEQKRAIKSVRAVLATPPKEPLVARNRVLLDESVYEKKRASLLPIYRSGWFWFGVIALALTAAALLVSTSGGGAL